MLSIILASTDEPLTKAWREFCGDLPFVTIHEGSILEVHADALLSPANSYGFMDGGIDAEYLRHLGSGVEAELQRAIRTLHFGELLVGQAEIIPTAHPRHPWLIAAPTMRVPMRLRESVNPYLAARGALLLATRGTVRVGPHAGQPVSAHVQTIAVPGLGTGVGGLGPGVCAHQVRAAIEDTLLKSLPPPATWAEASERHQRLYTDRPRRLQHDE